MTIEQTILPEADVSCGLHDITAISFTVEFLLLLIVNLDVMLEQHSLISLTCIQSSKDQGDKSFITNHYFNKCPLSGHWLTDTILGLNRQQ